MSKALRISLIGVLALIIGYAIYARRFQMEAKIWHWRHGYWTTVGTFDVPVPNHWLVRTQGPDGWNMTMMDTIVNRQSEHPLTTNVITVISLSQPLRYLDSWESVKRQDLERSGLVKIEERTLSLAGEKVICLGGYVFHDVLRAPGTTPLSLECRSAGQLSLMFVGYRSGVEDFYTIVSQIRKRR
jgi:hypothetical protein